MTAMTEDVLETYLIENQEKLYRAAYGYLHNREDALDAVQSTACAALETRRSLRDPDALAAWVRRILHNACMDLLRRRGREAPLPEEEPSAAAPPPPEESLEEELSRLPPEIQAVLRLRFYEDLPLRDIAAVTGANLSTVKTRLYTGLKKLRIELEGAIE